jgi:hypothetical protein
LDTVPPSENHVHPPRLLVRGRKLADWIKRPTVQIN